MQRINTKILQSIRSVAPNKVDDIIVYSPSLVVLFCLFFYEPSKPYAVFQFSVVSIKHFVFSIKISFSVSCSSAWFLCVASILCRTSSLLDAAQIPLYINRVHIYSLNLKCVVLLSDVCRSYPVFISSLCASTSAHDAEVDEAVDGLSVLSVDQLHSSRILAVKNCCSVDAFNVILKEPGAVLYNY